MRELSARGTASQAPSGELTALRVCMCLSQIWLHSKYHPTSGAPCSIARGSQFSVAPLTNISIMFSSSYASEPLAIFQIAPCPPVATRNEALPHGIQHLLGSHLMPRISLPRQALQTDGAFFSVNPSQDSHIGTHCMKRFMEL